MTNITKDVWEIVSNDMSIRKDLARGIINTRALAKYIMKNHGVSNSIDSVISAIRRFEKDKQATENFHTIKEVLKGAKITTRTNMACITIQENSQNAQILSEILLDPHLMKNESLRLTKGADNMKLMLSQQDVDAVKRMLKKDSILILEEDLAEINILLSEQAGQTKGLFARITNEIANYDININEVITVLPELLIFVKNRDLIKAHEALFALISPAKNA